MFSLHHTTLAPSLQFGVYVLVQQCFSTRSIYSLFCVFVAIQVSSVGIDKD